MKEILKALNQRPIAYYPIYVAATGSISSGVALSQLMYWFSTCKDKIYKTDREFEAETGHTAKEMQVVRKNLKKLPFLTITREGVPAKTHYAIDWDLYQSCMYQWSELTNEEGIVTRKSIQDMTNGADKTRSIVQTITESTQKITTESNIATDKSVAVADKSDDVACESFTETMLKAIEVAGHLSTKLSESIDNYKAPSEDGLHKWAKDIDRAIRLDKRTKAQLIETIDWIHNEDGTFWISNIMSGKKLRDQFDKLTAQRSVKEQKTPVRTRALEAFGKGEVFLMFKDTQNNNKAIHLCLWGEHGSLYDYKRDKYITKEKAKKVWDYIDKNFDELVAHFKAQENK